MSLALATLAILSVAAEPTAADSRLAAVDVSGTVFVSNDHGTTWHGVHQCPAPQAVDTNACGGSEPAASIAWVAHRLYLACAHDALHTWQPGQSSAQPAGLSMVSGVVALAGRENELLIADDEGGIWTYEPGHQATFMTEAPEPPAAMAASGTAILIAGSATVWQWTPTQSVQGWVPVTTAAACALAVKHGPDGQDRVWIAGAHGLLALDQGIPSTLLVSPVTGVAVAGAQVLVVVGNALSVLSAAPEAPSSATAGPGFTGDLSMGSGAGPVACGRESGPRIDWNDLSNRARWARWIPNLSAGLVYQRSTSNRVSRAVEVWLWLTWRSTNQEIVP